MMRFKFVPGVIFILVYPSLFPSMALSIPTVEIILDMSESMSKPIQGKPKYQIAIDSIIASLNDFQEKNQLGIRAFGHRFNTNQKTSSCSDSELISPFDQNSKKTLLDKLLSLRPSGYTSLAYSLDEAGKDIAKLPGPQTIILVSDGEDTCGGNTLESIKRLESKGVKVQIQAIGIGVDDKTAKYLEELSWLTNGRFHRVRKIEETYRALQSAQQSALLSRFTTKGDIGGLVDAGANRESALHVKAREYSSNYLGAGDTTDVFSFEGTIGEKYFIKVDSDTFINLEVYLDDNKKVFEILHKKGEFLSDVFLLNTSGKYYMRFSLDESKQAEYKFTLSNLVSISR
ncbi:MAG: VWA domain-containing protein [Bdellovibrionales bacterium]|nr:VWA domain-containing protein [Bdellovibrionales bacterium]